MPHNKCHLPSRRTTLAYLLFVVSSLTSVHMASAQNVNKPAKPGDVHLEYSRVYIHVGKTGFGHEHAVVGKLSSGNIDLNGSSGELIFAMQTFAADTAAARKYVGLAGTTDAGTQSKVNANMLGSNVLDVKRYPTATFQVKKITLLSQNSRRGLPQYQIEGDFTLHGKTRPLKFTADTDSKNGWLHLRGSFSILQSQFGMKPFTTALGTIGVADKLTIFGDLWIVPPQSQDN